MTAITILVQFTDKLAKRSCTSILFFHSPEFIYKDSLHVFLKKAAAEKKKAEESEKLVQKIQEKTIQNGKSLDTKESKKPSSRPFFNGFVNICQMDHSLLYDDERKEDSAARKGPHLKEN